MEILDWSNKLSPVVYSFILKRTAHVAQRYFVKIPLPQTVSNNQFNTSYPNPAWKFIQHLKHSLKCPPVCEQAAQVAYGHFWKRTSPPTIGNNQLILLISAEITGFNFSHRTGVKSKAWHFGSSWQWESTFCSLSRINEWKTPLWRNVHVTRYWQKKVFNFQLHLIQPLLHTLNICLWRLSLKLCLLICIPSSLSVFSLTMAARGRKATVCVSCASSSHSHTHVHTRSDIVLHCADVEEALPAVSALPWVKLYADVLWSMEMKTGSIFDQSTCCVISMLLSPVVTIWYLSQLSITSLIQMNSFSISGWHTLSAERFPLMTEEHSVKFPLFCGSGRWWEHHFMGHLLSDLFPLGKLRSKAWIIQEFLRNSSKKI